MDRFAFGGGWTNMGLERNDKGNDGQASKEECRVFRVLMLKRD
jgi:hypothetical protein